MSADAPAKDQDKFVLRLPDGMRDRLKAEAEANKRSMNAEIVARLEDSLTRAEREAAAAKAFEINRMVENYNYESERLARMQGDMARMSEYLHMMGESLRAAGVVFAPMPKREDDPPCG